MTATATPVTETQALDLLGAAKVVTIRQAYTALGFGDVALDPSTQILFSDDTLRECARANEAGDADWRLVYVTGTASLRDLREKFGTDTDVQPCFYDDNDWWLEESENEWANKKPDAGYRLFNCQKQFANTRWDDQNSAITELGSEYSRANEFAVSEACFTNFKTNDGERLLEDWWHWGETLDSDGFRVCVGGFGSVGWDVGDDHPGGSDSGLGVVVSRNPDL